MMIDLTWWAGLIAGIGWGLLGGFAMGVRWVRQLATEPETTDERKH